MTETQHPELPVFVVGEALVDIVIPDGEPPRGHVGGSPLNVAVGVARLGHPVTFACHIADDERGQAIVEHLAADDVALAEGSITADRTSTATAVLDETGAATYEFDLEWDLPGDLAVPEFGHLHVGSIAVTQTPGNLRVNGIAADAALGATISYDPNARPQIMGTPENAGIDVEAMLRLADVVKASNEDIEWLWDGMQPAAAITYFQSLGVRLTIITLGADGVLVGIGDEVEQIPADKSVKVVDTVGAGDSFMAGLISGLLDAGLLGSVEARERLAVSGMVDVRPAVKRAIECANITVSRPGANPPRRDELPTSE